MPIVVENNTFPNLKWTANNFTINVVLWARCRQNYFVLMFSRATHPFAWIEFLLFGLIRFCPKSPNKRQNETHVSITWLYFILCYWFGWISSIRKLSKISEKRMRSDWERIDNNFVITIACYPKAYQITYKINGFKD